MKRLEFQNRAIRVKCKKHGTQRTYDIYNDKNIFVKYGCCKCTKNLEIINIDNLYGKKKKEL